MRPNPHTLRAVCAPPTLTISAMLAHPAVAEDLTGIKIVAGQPDNPFAYFNVTALGAVAAGPKAIYAQNVMAGQTLVFEIDKSGACKLTVGAAADLVTYFADTDTLDDLTTFVMKALPKKLIELTSGTRGYVDVMDVTVEPEKIAAYYDSLDHLTRSDDAMLLNVVLQMQQAMSDRVDGPSTDDNKSDLPQTGTYFDGADGPYKLILQQTLGTRGYFRTGAGIVPPGHHPASRRIAVADIKSRAVSATEEMVKTTGGERIDIGEDRLVA